MRNMNKAKSPYKKLKEAKERYEQSVKEKGTNKPK